VIKIERRAKATTRDGHAQMEAGRTDQATYFIGSTPAVELALDLRIPRRGESC